MAFMKNAWMEWIKAFLIAAILAILVRVILFAPVVVEGPSEVGLLWQLQELMEKDWEKSGIVVISACGKNNIDRPTVIFNGLNIPTYFIFDGDAHCSAKPNVNDIKNSLCSVNTV